MPGGTIKDCLSSIGVALSALTKCGTLNEEWSLIKRTYFKKILVVHPDKGGDAKTFRDVQAAFEVLRTLFDSADFKSFSDALDQSTAHIYTGSKEDFKSSSTPSWEYYAEAAKEVAATYRVETARSNRSRCQASGSLIEKGHVRIGFMLESGSYGLWVKLECWRVPSKVWLGLPDPVKCRNRQKFEGALKRMNSVSLCGLDDLSAADRKKVVSYVMDKKHWTFQGVAEKVRKRPGADASAQASTSSGKPTDLSLVPAKAEKQKFVIPVPGQGAPKGSLAGQTVVLTGIFPEVGGGDGLSLGKDKVRKMITSFGGKVTTSVSGKTDILVVGKDPGFSKVSQARKSGRTKLLSLHDMKLGLERGSLEAAKGAKPMLVRSFSKGYAQRRGGPNGKALRASKAELAIAMGTAPAALENKVRSGQKAVATKKRPTSASASSKRRRLK